jgi:putative spermidine/putrescine transport system substrate-binding protein
MKKFASTVLIAALAAALTAGCGDKKEETVQAEAKSAQDAGQLVFVDWGGTNTDARVKQNIEPFEKETGIKVTVVTPSDYAKLIAMVENKTTEWDVMNCDAYWGVYAGKKGYLEPIDYKIVTEKLDKEVELEHVVGAEVYDSTISYNTDKYKPETAPKDWAEFFDTGKFPGKRAMWQYPVTVLEAALLADGVSVDKLYPLDLDRAFKKLDTIKDSIVWWTKGAQPAQMLSTGEADLALAWSGRILNAKDEGSPVALNYNQAMRIAAGWVVPKGAPNKENAMKFINWVSSAKMQAAFSSQIPYGSTNPDAIKLLSAEQLEKIGQSPEQVKHEFYINNDYWAENLNAVVERFNAWVQGN